MSDTQFILKEANRIAKELYGTEHLFCLGSLELKLQEAIKNLLEKHDNGNR